MFRTIFAIVVLSLSHATLLAAETDILIAYDGGEGGTKHGGTGKAV